MHWDRAAIHPPRSPPCAPNNWPADNRAHCVTLGRSLGTSLGLAGHKTASNQCIGKSQPRCACCPAFRGRFSSPAVFKHRLTGLLLRAADARKSQAIPDNHQSTTQVDHTPAVALAPAQGKSAKQDVQIPASKVTPKYQFFVYDTETTGFSARDDRIVEIAMQETESTREYSTLVSCAPREVHWRALKAHGISTEESLRHGLPFKQVADDLVQFVSESTQSGAIPVLVAHNGNAFDNRFLTAEFKRCGVAVPQRWQWLDTLPLVRHLLPELKKRSQAELRAFLQLPPPLVAHRAAADVAVLAEILKALVTRAGVGIQDLMTLECKHTGTFVAYEDQGATGQQQPNQQLAGKTSKKQQPVPMAAVTATHAQQQAGPYKGKPAPSATGFAASSVPDRVTSTDTGNTRQTSRRSAAEPMGTVNTQQANINETAGWQRVPWRWPFFNRREQPRMREEQPTYRARLDVSKMSVENAQHQDRYAMQKTAHMDAISDAIARAPTPSQSAADQVGMNAKQHRATVEKNETVLHIAEASNETLSPQLDEPLSVLKVANQKVKRKETAQHDLLRSHAESATALLTQAVDESSDTKEMKCKVDAKPAAPSLAKASNCAKANKIATVVITKVSKTPKVVKVPKARKVSKVSKVSTTPKVSTIPKVSTNPKISTTLKVSTAPKVSTSTKISITPKVSKVSNTSKVSKASKVSRVVKVSKAKPARVASGLPSHHPKSYMNNWPLGRCNAWQVFCDEKHGEIAAAHPQEKGRKVYSLLVAAWRDCSLKDRAKYEKLSQKIRRHAYAENRHIATAGTVTI